MENSERMHQKFLQNIHATGKIFQNFKEFYEILKKNAKEL